MMLLLAQATMYLLYLSTIGVLHETGQMDPFDPSQYVLREPLPDQTGGGLRVVVCTAAFHARVRGSVPGLGDLKETKMFLPHPRVKVSIVDLEDSVISIISPSSSGGSSGPV